MKNFKSIILLLFLSNFISFSTSIYGQDIGLFEVLPESTVDALTSSQLQRYNKILNQSRVTYTQFVKTNNIPSVQQNGAVDFNIPNLPCIPTFLGKDIFSFTNGNFHWYGEIENEVDSDLTGDDDCECSNGHAIILHTDGVLIGTITVDNRIYELQDLGEGTQMIVEKAENNEIMCTNDESEIEDSENHLNIENKYETSSISKTHMRSTVLCPVKVLVLYSSNAMDAVPNINSTINLSIRQMNQYLRNSLVRNLEMLLVETEEYNGVPETNSIQTDLENFRLASINGDVKDLRDLHNADLVFWFTDGNYGNDLGAASLSNSTSPGSNFAVAIIEAEEAIGESVFAHEAAHLFGCQHNFPRNFAFAHARDFRNCTKLKRTVVHRRGGNIPHYSNPNVKYDGDKTGLKDVEENWLQLTQQACVVANFKEDPLGGLQGYIDAPEAVCLNQVVHASAVILGGTLPNYNYVWSYSYDGFNFTTLPNNTPNATIPGVTLPPDTPGQFPIFIRVVVSDPSGTSIELFHQTIASNEDLGQTPPCFHMKPNDEGFNGNFSKTSFVDAVPNPSNGLIEIPINNKLSETRVKIKVLNEFGQIVFNKERVNIEGKNLKLDLRSFSSGTYFVVINNGDFNRISKVIKI